MATPQTFVSKLVIQPVEKSEAKLPDTPSRSILLKPNTKYFKNYPKLELHAHLHGSFSEETVLKLQVFNQEEDDVDPEDIPVDDLNSCFLAFGVAHQLTKTPGAVALATECTIREFADDGVIYLELRSTPRQEDKMSKREFLEGMVAGVLEVQKTDRRIIVTILVSINRGQPVTDAEENVDLALEFAKLYPKIFVGIDFSGNPTKGSFRDFLPSLEKARKGSLYLTLHCAEVENDCEVLEMLEFRPDRIGHFTQPPYEAVKKVVELQIPIELCVTSNVKSGTVNIVRDHQFGIYYPEHPIILGTDDKGVFKTNLSGEYFLVRSEFWVPDEFFWRMNDQAVDFCFAPPEVKEKLRKTLKDWKYESMR